MTGQGKSASDDRVIELLLSSAAGLGAAGVEADEQVELTPGQIEYLESQRLLHQLVAASNRQGGPFRPITDPLWLGRVKGGLAHQLRVELAAERVGQIFDQAHIRFLVLKGVAAAHLDHDNPALRESADLDLLVEPGDLERASAAFQRSGIELAHPVQRGWWQIQHAITFGVDGVEVDLHHRPLHQGPGFLARKLPLFAKAVRFEIAGQVFEAPDPANRLILAASQNVLAADRDRRLSNDLDVLRLRHHVDEAAHRAKAAGLGWVLCAGLSRSFALAGCDRSTVGGQSGRDSLLRWAYSGERSVLRTGLVEVALADWASRSRIIWCGLVPSEEYLAGRQRSRSEQAWRQVKRLASGISRREEQV